MSTPDKDEDIDRLVDIAAQELRQREQGASRAAPRKPRVGISWVVPVWMAALALWGWQLWPTGPSEAEIRAELDSLMVEARDAVERHLAEYKALPEKLPAPVPAVVVRYEVMDALATPPTYALAGQIGEISQRWTNAATTGSKP